MSGLIPQPFIDDLLHRTDLVELIDSYVPLKKRGTSHIACCPFHNEKSPSFNVVAKKQFYHCFGCGASGNAISFVMNYQNLGFIDAVETMAMRLGLTVPRDGQAEKNNPSSDLYKLLAEISTYYQKKLKLDGQIAINYLRSRGLSGKVAKLYQLGFAPEGWNNLEKTFARHQRELIATGMLIKNDEGKIYDRYRNRIIFPIHDRHGRIIGFGGRVLDDQKPKYLNSPETVIFQKSRELYGLHQILSQHKTADSIILVEGYMDVIALAQHGILNAVATLGTATSTYHIQLLAKHTKQLIFCFDGDSAGKQAAWRGLESSLPHLNAGLDAGFIFLPDGHDPDSLVRAEGKNNFLARLQQAIPLHRFFFDTLSKNINLLTPGGKTQLINLAKPLLQKMIEGSYKQLLIDDLARLTHIESHRLNLLIKDQSEKKLREQNTTIARSPARIAVALLLQNPEIYTHSIQHINLSVLDEQEHHILLKLMQQLALSPQANTATLIELWRNSSYFESINKLAAWDHQVPEQELIKEFIDILLFLQKQNRDLFIRRLIDKSRQVGLSETEKINLLEMLKERHL
jgi:DNA primase